MVSSIQIVLDLSLRSWMKVLVSAGYTRQHRHNIMWLPSGKVGGVA
jgi:hypothetical protein